ncbi:MAG TPA: M13 family metallopeptidase [Terriglobales bacterium]|nr:M13 family metallopeptidase [Terriglobales bacterium]
MHGLRVLVAFLMLAVSLVTFQRLQAQAPAAQQEVAPKPATFDINALDRKVDPCTDFYQFACGGWMARNPIPPDQSTWGRFNQLFEYNQAILHQILEKYAPNDPTRTPVQQKIGDFYASCMDESTVESKGLQPLQPELDRIAALKNKSELANEIARLHQIGVNGLFQFTSGQDAKDATQEIAQADQGGLGLPDRDYYLKDDPKSQETRQKYTEHVQNMFRLLGEPQPQATGDAKTVMEIETALAKVSMTRVDRRVPENVYHKLPIQQLASMTPAFSWDQYLSAVNAPPISGLNVRVPDFFKGINGLLDSTSLDNWKTYLRWHLVHAAAPLLAKGFVDENFSFYGKTLTGAEQIRPRWKRCVSMTDDDLGEALGQPYVQQTFGGEGKERTLKMVHELEKSLGEDITQLPWMTEATKKAALVKLHNIANKIGYPDHWRDYSKVQIVRGDALGNDMRATDFEFHRQLNKIGKPVDRGEWQMSPPTVNAYYDSQMNDINFPAGILQPPFYDNHIDDAVNYGGIGMVIGHELTHGFDDRGRKYDAHGNLNDWWTQEDAKEFEKRAECIVNEYAGFTAVDDVKLNGKLTLGENTADNGGLRIARMALHDDLAGKKVGAIDGFTPDQRLFLGYAQIWCQNQRPEARRLRATVDPHSPGRWRVNGVIQNMPEFGQAFGCKAGAPMVRPNACRVW